LSTLEAAQLGGIDAINTSNKIGAYDSGVGWWLRSPGNAFYLGAYVYADGRVRANGDNMSYDNLFSVRSAFNLNASTVLFTSDAKADVGEGIKAVTALTGGEFWKFTFQDYYDASTNPTGQKTPAITMLTLKSGGEMAISFANATTGTNEYVSALLKDGGYNYRLW